MVGSVAHLLPVTESDLKAEITHAFGRLGEKVLTANLEAFRLGQEVGAAIAR